MAIPKGKVCNSYSVCYAWAMKHLGIGMLVGRLVGLSVGFDTTFKKVPKPYNRDCYDIRIIGYR